MFIGFVNSGSCATTDLNLGRQWNSRRFSGGRERRRLGDKRLSEGTIRAYTNLSVYELSTTSAWVILLDRFGAASRACSKPNWREYLRGLSIALVYTLCKEVANKPVERAAFCAQAESAATPPDRLL